MTPKERIKQDQLTEASDRLLAVAKAYRTDLPALPEDTALELLTVAHQLAAPIRQHNEDADQTIGQLLYATFSLGRADVVDGVNTLLLSDLLGNVLRALPVLIKDYLRRDVSADTLNASAILEASYAMSALSADALEADGA